MELNNRENLLEEIRNRVSNRYYEKKGNIYIQNDISWLVTFAEDLIKELTEKDK